MVTIPDKFLGKNVGNGKADGSLKHSKFLVKQLSAVDKAHGNELSTDNFLNQSSARRFFERCCPAFSQNEHNEFSTDCNRFGSQSVSSPNRVYSRIGRDLETPL